jgi:hypothetical protein
MRWSGPESRSNVAQWSCECSISYQMATMFMANKRLNLVRATAISGWYGVRYQPISRVGLVFRRHTVSLSRKCQGCCKCRVVD